jgi:tripartite-type tricarboxylate transporter receptor subunit TctC
MRRIVAIALAVLGLFVLAAPLSAQEYPDRTVTIIVPYPAGGPTDQLARVVANALSKKFGQNVIVENVTGGGTIIATNRVAKATPDGYTLLLHNLQISANPTLYKNLPFDTEKDLTPVMFINRNPLVLIGRKSLEANTLAEIIALMKKQRLKVAIPGYGATGHLATVLLEEQAGVKVDLIPYRGGAPVMTDLLGDHVDLFIGTPQQFLQHVATGQLKAFGITAKEKSPQYPTADSVVKLLGPKLDVQYWQALFAPAGTPDAIVKTLNSAMEEVVVNNPAIVKTWTDTGVEAFPKNERSPAAGREIMQSEIARWGQVIRDNNIHVNQ